MRHVIETHRKTTPKTLNNRISKNPFFAPFFCHTCMRTAARSVKLLPHLHEGSMPPNHSFSRAAPPSEANRRAHRGALAILRTTPTSVCQSTDRPAVCQEVGVWVHWPRPQDFAENLARLASALIIASLDARRFALLVVYHHDGGGIDRTLCLCSKL